MAFDTNQLSYFQQYVDFHKRSLEKVGSVFQWVLDQYNCNLQVLHVFRKDKMKQIRETRHFHSKTLARLLLVLHKNHLSS